MLDEHTKADVARRLKKAEGQVAGLLRMVEGGQYCVDVLRQVAAVQGALAQTSRIILGSHLKTCVTHAFDSGDVSAAERVISELEDVFARYLR